MVRPAKATAQAQAQQQEIITHSESLSLVRALLRVSIFHISFLRGLFPDSCFKGIDMNNLNGMHIKMLTPKTPEAKKLVDWVELGVYDAVKKGFADKLFFGFAEDADATVLIEEYIFSFSYPNGTVQLEVGQKVKGKSVAAEKLAGEKPSMQSVKYQVTRLMRMLVQICQTLEEVPTERYLFMKMTYNDSTPDEYEPPCFQPVEESSIGHFKRKPFSMYVGGLSTEHHAVNLKVKSMLDACEGEPDAEQMQEEMGSVQPSGSDVTELSCNLQDDANSQDESTGQPVEDQAAAAAEGDADAMHVDAPLSLPVSAQVTDPKSRLQDDIQALMSEVQLPLASAADEGNFGKHYEALRAYCLQRTVVSLTSSMTQFIEIPGATFDKVFQQLVQEGLLVPAETRGSYRVLQRAAVNACSHAEVLAAQMTGLRVQQVAAAAAMTDAMVQPCDSAAPLANITNSSRLGKSTRGASGPEATKSMQPPAAAGKAYSQQVVEMSQPGVFFDASQESNRINDKRRKASYVADPIHQGKRHCGMTTRSRTVGAQNAMSGLHFKLFFMGRTRIAPQRTDDV